jgi:uncharacterized membrane protein YgcG
MVSESSGRNESERRNGLETGAPEAEPSRLEHCLDEAQHSAIRYPLGHQREKFFVIDGPEKISEVRIHDPLRPALDFFPDLAQCILCRSPSPINALVRICAGGDQRWSSLPRQLARNRATGQMPANSPKARFWQIGIPVWSPLSIDGYSSSGESGSGSSAGHSEEESVREGGRESGAALASASLYWLNLYSKRNSCFTRGIEESMTWPR